MNINERNKIQEDSPEREDVIYKLAQREAQEDPDKQPMTLELTNTSIRDYRPAGFDTFRLEIAEVTDGGRRREQRSLHIVKDFMTFVNHYSYSGIMKVIPATKHNLELLASHWEGKRWFIHEKEFREKVEKMAEAVVPIRNEKEEMTEPQYMPHVAARDEDSAKKRLADLDQQIRAAEQLLQQKRLEKQQAEEPEPEPQPIEPDEPDEDMPSFMIDDDDEDEFVPESKPLGNEIDAVKERVRKEHAEEIEKMKKRGIKRVEMTREWREWMEQEIQNESA